jgi:signal transduction histidine kinase
MLPTSCEHRSPSLQTRFDALPAGAQKERLLLDVARLGATAEQLLDIQRFTTVHTWEDVDLVRVCETVAADMAPIAIAAGYDLEFDPVAESVVVLGDSASLARAVTNLVKNAIEHGGDKGRIGIGVIKNGSIEVSDEGPGIPVAERDKVFELFYRVTPKPTGAGLGLSLVQRIVQSHKGHVVLVDQPKGARFRINLGQRPATHPR